MTCRRHLTAGLWLLASLLIACTARATDFERMADCIRQVESPRGELTGRHGERSAYHMTAAVWYSYTAIDFRAASDPRMQVWARRVALEHLQHLERNLENPTPYRIALAWNAGLGAANHAARVTAAHAAYARRVENLYLENP